MSLSLDVMAGVVAAPAAAAGAVASAAGEADGVKSTSISCALGSKVMGADLAIEVKARNSCGSSELGTSPSIRVTRPLAFVLLLAGKR
jgi:hypothetical protein